MNLSKKLDAWQQAKLIDGTTADRIMDFEQQQSKPLALWAFGGLGVFAILVGLVSLVASNWMYTPDWMKLAADLVLCFGIAIALYRVIASTNTDNPSKLWLREMLVILYYGFTLASMALIGQTYQLGGSIALLLFVWTIATLPIVLLGRGKFLTILWIIGTASTYALSAETMPEHLYHMQHISPYLRDVFIGLLFLLSPFFFILLSRLPWLVKNRPIMAGEISRYSWLSIAIAGWFAQFLWYESISFSDTEFPAFITVLITVFLATSAMVFFIPKLYPSRPRDTQRVMRMLLIVVFLLGATAFWHHHSYSLVGALTNLLYMGALASAALKINSIRLFNMMTAFICVRLLFVYFEVFGSMFETGLGLIIGGIVVLLIVWGWFKKSSDIARYFGLSSTDKMEFDTHEK